MQNSANTKSLNLDLLTELTCFIYYIMIGEMFWGYRKYPNVKETGSSYGQKILSSDNPSQNIWHKLKKCIKIGQDFKNVISHFAWFLTAIVNV